MMLDDGFDVDVEITYQLDRRTKKEVWNSEREWIARCNDMEQTAQRWERMAQVRNLEMNRLERNLVNNDTTIVTMIMQRLNMILASLAVGLFCLCVIMLLIIS